MIGGCDIVISSVPHGSASAGQFDANWVAPGTFVAAVDLGFAWQRASLAAFDRTVTDDREQSTVGPTGTLNYDGPFAAELSDLVAGRVAGRESAGASLMSELGWTAVRVRYLTRGGYKEQVRGYVRDSRRVSRSPGC